MEQIAQKMDDYIKQMNDLQKQMNVFMEKRIKLVEQQSENEIVKRIQEFQEIDLVENGAKVYKLIGPVLMKQEVKEVQQNIDKRIEFIKKEMNKIENQIQVNEQLQIETKNKVAELQATIKTIQHQYQQQQQQK